MILLTILFFLAIAGVIIVSILVLAGVVGVGALIIIPFLLPIIAVIPQLI